MENALAGNFGHISISQPGDLSYPLDWSMDYATLATPGGGTLPAINFDEAYPRYETSYEPYMQFDVPSSNDSYAASQYDTESYLQSPVSPTFSSVMSAVSGHEMSEPLSPSAMNDDTISEFASSELADSDDVLEQLLSGIEPSEDGRYYCADVEAEGHSESCDFVAERKCMLRSVPTLLARLTSPLLTLCTRKHLESTLKTNICRHIECNNMQFSSKAVLTRHEKEAHGLHAAHPFFCPVDQCERHTRGFPREYNMGDHISRVHKELDVNIYLKKSKRTSKKGSATVSTIVSTTSTAAKARSSSSPAGVRKSSVASATKTRRERLERQYKTSREAIGKLMFKLPEQPGSQGNDKYVQQLKTEIFKLEEVMVGLQASAGND
jgi:hypothetical protein